jgi:hypothetical protein
MCFGVREKKCYLFIFCVLRNLLCLSCLLTYIYPRNINKSLDLCQSSSPIGIPFPAFDHDFTSQKNKSRFSLYFPY